MTAETNDNAPRFSVSERDSIRRALKRYKEDLDIGFDKLRQRIAEQTEVPEIDVDRRTLSRFVNGEHGTRDATVGIYKQFIESLPEPDPIYDLGDAMSDFFGLPLSRKERDPYMAEMADIYEGCYQIFGRQPNQEGSSFLCGTLFIEADPLSAYFRAHERAENHIYTETTLPDQLDVTKDAVVYVGLAIPRKTDLFVLLRDVQSANEKIYLLKYWQPLPKVISNENELVTRGPMLAGYMMERYQKSPEESGYGSAGFIYVNVFPHGGDGIIEIEFDEDK